MEDKVITKKTIVSYKEDLQDKDYNRYIVNSISGIDMSDVRKIIHFTNENMFIVYTNETLNEAIHKWIMQHKQ